MSLEDTIRAASLTGRRKNAVPTLNISSFEIMLCCPAGQADMRVVVASRMPGNSQNLTWKRSPKYASAKTSLAKANLTLDWVKLKRYVG